MKFSSKRILSLLTFVSLNFLCLASLFPFCIDATLRKTSSNVGIAALYDFIFNCCKLSSKSLKKLCKEKSLLLLFFIFSSSFRSDSGREFSLSCKLSSLSPSFFFFGILNIISSDKISYSTWFALFRIKSIISLSSAFSSLFILIDMNFPNRSMRNNGDPMHFIFPSAMIPILFPNTLASSI